MFVENAEDGAEDILIRITVCNRGGEEAELQVLPTLWFRNDWAEWIAKPRRYLSGEKSVRFSEFASFAGKPW